MPRPSGFGRFSGSSPTSRMDSTIQLAGTPAMSPVYIRSVEVWLTSSSLYACGASASWVAMNRVPR